MEMVQVTSSNVKEVGYDEAEQVLRVKFNSGAYVYEDVPVRVWENLKKLIDNKKPGNAWVGVEAQSVGQFIAVNLKPYKYKKI